MIFQERRKKIFYSSTIECPQPGVPPPSVDNTEEAGVDCTREPWEVVESKNLPEDPQPSDIHTDKYWDERSLDSEIREETIKKYLNDNRKVNERSNEEIDEYGRPYQNEVLDPYYQSTVDCLITTHNEIHYSDDSSSTTRKNRKLFLTFLENGMTTKNLYDAFHLRTALPVQSKKGNEISLELNQKFPTKYMKQVKSKSITLRKWEITLSAYTLATDTKQAFTVGTPNRLTKLSQTPVFELTKFKISINISQSCFLRFS